MAHYNLQAQSEGKIDWGYINAITKRRFVGLEVGDVVERPMTVHCTKSKALRKGTVIYIHPKRWYHMVAFENGTRECYLGACRENLLDIGYPATH